MHLDMMETMDDFKCPSNQQITLVHRLTNSTVKLQNFLGFLLYMYKVTQ